MSTDTRPRAAIALYTDGLPWYPYREVAAGQILYTRYPVLPNPGCYWSNLFRGDLRLHIDLTDERTLAELIYCTRARANSTELIDPIRISEDNLMHRIRHTLIACRCNPRVLAGWVGDDYGTFLTSAPRTDRMVRCRARAYFLAADRLQLSAAPGPVGGGGVG